jgi:hypothetical protein
VQRRISYSLKRLQVEAWSLLIMELSAQGSLPFFSRRKQQEETSLMINTFSMKNTTNS